jgi:glycosyltransferase involved in cell wall biosynthesis
MRDFCGEKVLFVSVTPWLGGPARSLATLLRYRESRQTVLACAEGELTDLVGGYESVGRWVPLWRHRRLRRLSRAVSAAGLSCWIIVNRANLAAIHANGLSELNMVGLGAAVARTPVIVWNHASVLSPVGRRVARFWRRVLPSATWVAVSDVARSVVCSATAMSPSNVPIVPNPIDPADVVARSPARTDERIVISYLSEASHVKGFDVLVRVIASLENQPVRWDLYTSLDRSPAAWRDLEQHERVEVRGRVADVSLAYAGSDIVFCPSRRESFGRVAAEAMLNGIPVVASDIPAFRELFGDDEAGIGFAVGDADSAAAGLRRLIADGPLRRKLGEAGRARAAKFDPRTVVRAFEHIYASAGAGTAASEKSSVSASQ